jgi:hypothetical protein
MDAGGVKMAYLRRLPQYLMSTALTLLTIYALIGNGQ